MPVFASSLTATGVFWACLSLAAAILICSGFYLPFWLQGALFNSTEVSFGSFRRCSYPRMEEDGGFQIVHECGRYTTFHDIPSVSWQISTITVGFGASTSLLVAFTTISACCVADVVTKRAARVLGLVQTLTGTCHISWSFYLMGSGVVLLLFCTVLSLWASRIKPHSYRI
ncbi:LHFPL tetraspan subfamily member 6 protein-like isoform X2 [Tachypleus tridentatus]|uniref:LHFPL tetraspan subfamily member 6 protein-like isoform X2 n=1 Tax=Tachypleus tridentatus TaxID=6853 RepID=UPI003FCFE085